TSEVHGRSRVCATIRAVGYGMGPPRRPFSRQAYFGAFFSRAITVGRGNHCSGKVHWSRQSTHTQRTICPSGTTTLRSSRSGRSVPVSEEMNPYHLPFALTTNVTEGVNR